MRDWREPMSVGNAITDSDYRYLPCLINAIDLASPGPFWQAGERIHHLTHVGVDRKLNVSTDDGETSRTKPRGNRLS